jgi:hypothetical protein
MVLIQYFRLLLQLVVVEVDLQIAMDWLVALVAVAKARGKQVARERAGKAGLEVVFLPRQVRVQIM